MMFDLNQIDLWLKRQLRKLYLVCFKKPINILTLKKFWNFSPIGVVPKVFNTRSTWLTSNVY